MKNLTEFYWGKRKILFTQIAIGFFYCILWHLIMVYNICQSSYSQVSSLEKIDSLYAGIFLMPFCRLLIFFKTFCKILSGIPSVSNSLDPDQAQHLVGPDLGPNCLRHLVGPDLGPNCLRHLVGHDLGPNCL